MAGNDPRYPSSSPSTFGKRSPASSDWRRCGSGSSAGQTTPLTLSASPYQATHGSMASLLHDPGHNAKIDAEAGELWLSAKENEDPWPVVICDEELLQTLLDGKFRPVNARQADGNWYRGYGPGGGLAEQRCFATMRLGTAKLCWTPWKRLIPFNVLDVKTVQESAQNLELVKAYAEAIEQYGRNDLTYWKDKLFAKQLSDAIAFEPLEVKENTGTITTKREQQPSNAATRQPVKVENKTSKKRKATLSGFKHPPKVVAGIKVWGCDDMSDSGDEAVRDYKKIKLELEEDGPLPSMQQGRAPIPQVPTVEKEDTSTKHPLQTGSTTKKEVKLEDDKGDTLFLSPPPQSQASRQRASNPNTHSETFGLDCTPIEHLPTAPDRLAKSSRFSSPSSMIPSSPPVVRTHKSPSGPSFERIVAPAASTTQNNPSRPRSEHFATPGELYYLKLSNLRDASTEDAAGKSPNPLFSTPQQPTNDQASTPSTPANSSTPLKQPFIITLYIGNSHTTISIPRSSLHLSRHLFTKLSYDPTEGAYIMSPLLASIKPEDFAPVAAFLNDPSDIPACLATLHPGTDPAEVFRKCAMTYHIANQLGITALAAAANQRLAGLDVEPTLGLLSTFAYLLRRGALREWGGLRKMAVEYLAKWYWELMRVDEDAFAEILAADRGFEAEVLGGVVMDSELGRVRGERAIGKKGVKWEGI